jgi:hypothetical protein
MRAFLLSVCAICLLAAANSAQAQGYWLDYCCAGYEGLHAPPNALVLEPWPTEAYYAPIGPQPWYGSMTVAEQARLFAARRAEMERQREASADE